MDMDMDMDMIHPASMHLTISIFVRATAGVCTRVVRLARANCRPLKRHAKPYKSSARRSPSDPS